MASSFKNFLPEDIAITRTLLHEAIPVTGTIVSGTYQTGGELTPDNIKDYSHGMFESVYDYPYLSSSANQIFDITVGYASGSALSGNLEADGILRTQQAKKINIYNQMTLLLNNLDVSGNIKPFDRSGADDEDEETDMREAFFVSFARLLVKDEIKKNSFRMTVFTGSSGSVAAGTRPGIIPAPHAKGLTVVLGDYGAQTTYKSNSPAGEYGLLYTSSARVGEVDNPPKGLLFYQAGLAVITASLYGTSSALAAAELKDINVPKFGVPDNAAPHNMTSSVINMFRTGSIKQCADALRYTIDNIQFNNTTELNSTIYFCRAHNTEYNYSANPTYVSSSEIVVKGENPMADPVAYITSVGLYSPDNELLAVAKLSEPLKKTPSNELTLRVRLDY
tara:strand:- start:60003 stop:61178 length:1176 start_codon:yes stop_codon:yes gene_type:complete